MRAIDKSADIVDMGVSVYRSPRSNGPQVGMHEKRPRCWGRDEGCFVLRSRRLQVRVPVVLGAWRLTGAGCSAIIQCTAGSTRCMVLAGPLQPQEGQDGPKGMGITHDY